jgi:hypothetical protein
MNSLEVIKKIKKIIVIKIGTALIAEPDGFGRKSRLGWMLWPLMSPSS